jgi:hypothetical protein
LGDFVSTRDGTEDRVRRKEDGRDGTEDGVLQGKEFIDKEFKGGD